MKEITGDYGSLSGGVALATNNRSFKQNDSVCVSDATVQGCQIGFFDAKFNAFGFFRGSWREKNCLAFWLFLLNIWLFLEALGPYYETGV